MVQLYKMNKFKNLKAKKGVWGTYPSFLINQFNSEQ